MPHTLWPILLTFLVSGTFTTASRVHALSLLSRFPSSKRGLDLAPWLFGGGNEYLDCMPDTSFRMPQQSISYFNKLNRSFFGAVPLLPPTRRQSRDYLKRLFSLWSSDIYYLLVLTVLGFCLHIDLFRLRQAGALRTSKSVHFEESVSFSAVDKVTVTDTDPDVGDRDDEYVEGRRDDDPQNEVIADNDIYDIGHDSGISGFDVKLEDKRDNGEVVDPINLSTPTPFSKTTQRPRSTNRRTTSNRDSANRPKRNVVLKSPPPPLPASSVNASTNTNNSSSSSKQKRKQKHGSKIEPTAPTMPKYDMRGVVFPKCATMDQAMQALRAASFTYRETRAGGYWRRQRMREAGVVDGTDAKESRDTVEEVRDDCVETERNNTASSDSGSIAYSVSGPGSRSGSGLAPSLDTSVSDSTSIIPSLDSPHTGRPKLEIPTSSSNTPAETCDSELHATTPLPTSLSTEVDITEVGPHSSPHDKQTTNEPEDYGWTTICRRRRARNAKRSAWPYGNDHKNKKTKKKWKKDGYYKSDVNMNDDGGKPSRVNFSVPRSVPVRMPIPTEPL